MRILWLQDLPILPPIGGAQLTDWQHFKEGIRRGHGIDLAHPRTFNSAAVDWADILILSNSVTFPEQTLKFATEKPFILFSHDYFHCHWRGYFPLLDKCFKCGRVKFWRELYLQSKLNIFLSPLHYEMHQSLIPELADHPHVEIPSPIDTELFKPMEVERKPNTVLWLGPFTRYKGIHLALAFAQAKKDYTYSFLGQDANGIEEPWADKIRALGYKVAPTAPNEALPQVYSSFEYFLELPAGPMPCERVALEARCCGCKIIANDLLGAASYDWFKHGTVDDVRKHVSESPRTFWETIEKIV